MCFYKKEEVDIEKWEVEDNFEIGETEERGRKFETVKVRHDGDTLLFFFYFCMCILQCSHKSL